MHNTEWLSLTSEELREKLKSLGEAPFRADQLSKWFCLGALPDEMTNIPKSLREKLSDRQTGLLFYPKIVKKQVSVLDSTVKYLFEMHDGQLIESVVMKYTDIHIAEMLDENEVVLEIVSEDISLRAFCCPYTPHLPYSDIILDSFLTSNIVQEEAFCLPQKMEGFCSYHITAKVLNTSLRIVCVNDIKIILDIPLPKDIPNGAFVSFDTVRLDWNQPNVF